MKYPIYITVRPFRSRGHRYVPGEIIVEPGKILSFRSKVTEGHVFVVPDWSESTQERLRVLNFRNRYAVDYLATVQDYINKHTSTEEEVPASTQVQTETETQAVKTATTKAVPKVTSTVTLK